MTPRLKQALYIELRKTASNLYSTQQQIRHVLAGTRIEEAPIDLQGAAINIWDSVLGHAEDKNKLSSLVTFMLSENTNSSFLQTLIHTLENGEAFITPLENGQAVAGSAGDAVNTLLVYDTQDSQVARELKAQLFPLTFSGQLRVTDLYTDAAGRNRQEHLSTLLDRACLLLLLLTPEFFNPENACLPLAFTAISQRKTVVPVFMSDCLGGRIQVLRDIVSLPADGIPVSRAVIRSEALMKIALEVEQIAQRIKNGY